MQIKFTFTRAFNVLLLSNESSCKSNILHRTEQPDFEERLTYDSSNG